MLRSPVSGSTPFSHAAFFPGQSFWAAADPQRCLQHGDRLRCSRSSNNQLGAGAGGCTPRFHCRAFALADVKGSAASFNIPLASIYTPLPRCFQILSCPCLRSAGAISDSLLSGLGAAEQLLLPPAAGIRSLPGISAAKGGGNPGGCLWLLLTRLPSSPRDHRGFVLAPCHCCHAPRRCLAAAGGLRAVGQVMQLAPGAHPKKKPRPVPG